MQKAYKILLISALLLVPFKSLALQEVGSDSRIRTLIYGKNDVFRINTVYGFQTMLELDPNEKIMTISVGNPNLFKIIPSGSRLYLKALINDQITNMTVVSDLRTYQFELTSNADNPDDMMYAVRFIYTENMSFPDNVDARPMNIYNPIKLGGTSYGSSPSLSSSFHVPSVSQMVGTPGEISSPDAPLSMQNKPTVTRGGMLNLPQVHMNPSN